MEFSNLSCSSQCSVSSAVQALGTEGLPQNMPPPNLASFGHVAVSSAGELTVKLIEITGEVLYQKVLSSTPEGSSDSMHA
jgi:hypothetical protein